VLVANLDFVFTKFFESVDTAFGNIDMFLETLTIKKADLPRFCSSFVYQVLLYSQNKEIIENFYLAFDLFCF
jgi:hypothetical protein